LVVVSGAVVVLPDTVVTTPALVVAVVLAVVVGPTGATVLVVKSGIGVVVVPLLGQKLYPVKFEPTHDVVQKPC